MSLWKKIENMHLSCEFYNEIEDMQIAAELHDVAMEIDESHEVEHMEIEVYHDVEDAEINKHRKELDTVEFKQGVMGNIKIFVGPGRQWWIHVSIAASEFVKSYPETPNPPSLHHIGSTELSLERTNLKLEMEIDFTQMPDRIS